MEIFHAARHVECNAALKRSRQRCAHLRDGFAGLLRVEERIEARVRAPLEHERRRRDDHAVELHEVRMLQDAAEKMRENGEEIERWERKEPGKTSGRRNRWRKSVWNAPHERRLG